MRPQKQPQSAYAPSNLRLPLPCASQSDPHTVRRPSRATTLPGWLRSRHHLSASARTITARVEKPGGQFVTSASMLLVAVLLVIVFLLIIALTTWLALLLLAVALCRGAAAADARDLDLTARHLSNAATERYPSGAAPESRARVTRPRHAAPQHGFPSRTRRKTKHAPRVI